MLTVGGSELLREGRTALVLRNRLLKGLDHWNGHVCDWVWSAVVIVGGRRDRLLYVLKVDLPA